MIDYWKLFDPRLESFSSGNDKETTPPPVPGTMLGTLHTWPLTVANITKLSVKYQVDS